MAHDPVNMAVARTMNERGHPMEKIIIAEHVEDMACIALPEQLVIDYIQGHNIEKPFMLVQE